MDLSITLIGIVLVIVAIWVILEIKRFRHRALAIFLVFILLFSYFSFTAVFSGKKLNLSSIDGIKEAGGIYYSWLATIFTNVKSLTSNAVKMDWGAKNTVGNLTNNS
jgi:ACR3 family arsenite efflux pump ArsB